MTYIFNDAFVVPRRIRILQQTLKGIPVVIFFDIALFAMITSNRHQTNDELSNSSTALRKFYAFSDRNELSNRGKRVQIVDNMANHRWLHHFGKCFKERRLVGSKMVKIKSKRFESNHVKDRFPNVGLNYQPYQFCHEIKGEVLTFNIAVLTALFCEDIDQLFSLCLNSRKEVF